MFSWNRVPPGHLGNGAGFLSGGRGSSAREVNKWGAGDKNEKSANGWQKEQSIPSTPPEPLLLSCPGMRLGNSSSDNANKFRLPGLCSHALW